MGNSTTPSSLSYHVKKYRLATDLSPVRGALPTYPEKLMVGIRSGKGMNTNRLTQKEPALMRGAIISTATAFVLITSAVTAAGKPVDVGAKPTRQEILTQLRLMSLDYREYLCNKEIIRKESNFNSNAKNGSHYGLAQGRSPYLATATIEEQLQWFIRYIRSRYGDGCRALNHHFKHNWY